MSTGNAILHVQVMDGLTAVQTKIATYLIGRANGRRFCWPSVEEIMVDCRVDSNRTVSTATKVLTKRGVLRVVRHRRGRNHYHVADRLYDTPVELPSRRLRNEDVQPATHQEDVQPATHQQPEDVQPAAHQEPHEVQLDALKDVQLDAHPKTQERDSSSKTPPLTPRRRGERVSEDDRFDDFWKDYPKKEDKGKAYKAYVRALKAVGGDPDDILDALFEAKQENHRFRGDYQFIPYPATWLNAGPWHAPKPKMNGGGEAAHAH
jgi:hypothetical protein